MLGSRCRDGRRAFNRGIQTAQEAMKVASRLTPWTMAELEANPDFRGKAELEANPTSAAAAWEKTPRAAGAPASADTGM